MTSFVVIVSTIPYARARQLHSAADALTANITSISVDVDVDDNAAFHPSSSSSSSAFNNSLLRQCLYSVHTFWFVSPRYGGKLSIISRHSADRNAQTK
jgi:hypothetical protein